MKKIISSVLFYFLAITAFSQVCINPGSLINVKRVTVAGYQKVIFTFKKPLQTNFLVSAVTNTTANYFDEGGDQNITAGCSFKKIVFTGVDWMCFTPSLFNVTNRIKAIKCKGRFEGYLTYVIGYCTSTYHHQQIVNKLKLRQIILCFKN